jgi:uncharacterized protein YchJ
MSCGKKSIIGPQTEMHRKPGRIGYAFDSSQSAPKPGRHDPCWFGSGKKYKQCPLKQER